MLYCVTVYFVSRPSKRYVGTRTEIIEIRKTAINAGISVSGISEYKSA